MTYLPGWRHTTHTFNALRAPCSTHMNLSQCTFSHVEYLNDCVLSFLYIYLPFSDVWYPDVRPPANTRHCITVGSMLGRCRRRRPTLKEHWFNLSFLLCGSCWRTIVYYYHPANTRRLPNVILMLVQRWRRWTNIQITLVPCLVSTDCFTSTQSSYSDHTEHDMLVQCWPNIGPASKTVGQL